MILVGVEGPVFRVAVAIKLERIVINHLVSLDLEADGKKSTLKLSMISSALTTCANELRGEYVALARRVSPYATSLYTFPNPTPDPSSGGSLPKLTYVGRLSRENVMFQLGDSPTALEMDSFFLAKFTSSDSFDAQCERPQPDETVVVKFAKERYNKLAHELLAKEGLAPKLYGCYRVLGARIMVIMERLEGRPLESAEQWEQQPDPSAFDDIEAAVKLLHDNDIVFGDLRASNIVIHTDNKHAKLVDFDWCGKHDTDLYPIDINLLKLKGTWHGTVEPGGVMLKKHDEWALHYIIKGHYFFD